MPFSSSDDFEPGEKGYEAMEMLYYEFCGENDIEPNFDEFDTWMGNIVADGDDFRDSDGAWASFLEEMGARDEDTDVEVGDTPG